MKILQIINNLGSGGAESMLISFLKNSKNKVQIDLLLLVDDKMVYDLPENVRLFVLQPKGKRYSLIKLFRLLKLIRKENYDIVHAHLFPAQYYLAIIKVFLSKKTKIVTTEHNTTNKRRQYFITRMMDYIVYILYDYIIFISKGVKKQFVKDYNFIKVRGSVINNGISLKHFKPKLANIKKDKIRLLMVARFTMQKDHITLLKALELLDNKYNLSLVGEGEQLEKIKKYVELNNLNHCVHFMGFQKDIARIYSEHDIFIISSNWEGFGLVAVEAMASGLPVIASNVNGLKDLVKGAGLLFEKGNEKELAKLILKVANNKEFKENLIKQGLVRAKEYNIKKLVKETLNLYKEVLYLENNNF